MSTAGRTGTGYDEAVPAGLADAAPNAEAEPEPGPADVAVAVAAVVIVIVAVVVVPIGLVGALLEVVVHVDDVSVSVLMYSASYLSRDRDCVSPRA
jgi:hypothetical protein